MNNLMFSIILCLVIYLLYIIFVINKPDKLTKFKKGVIVSYLVKIYHLDLKRINIKSLVHVISFSIAFIISTTFYVVSFVNNYYLKLLLCFVVLILMQLIIYHIIGKVYKNKQKK